LQRRRAWRRDRARDHLRELRELRAERVELLAGRLGPVPRPVPRPPRAADERARLQDRPAHHPRRSAAAEDRGRAEERVLPPAQLRQWHLLRQGRYRLQHLLSQDHAERGRVAVRALRERRLPEPVEDQPAGESELRVLQQRVRLSRRREVFETALEGKCIRSENRSARSSAYSQDEGISHDNYSFLVNSSDITILTFV